MKINFEKSVTLSAAEVVFLRNLAKEFAVNIKWKETRAHMETFVRNQHALSSDEAVVVVSKVLASEPVYTTLVPIEFAVGELILVKEFDDEEWKERIFVERNAHGVFCISANYPTLRNFWPKARKLNSEITPFKEGELIFVHDFDSEEPVPRYFVKNVLEELNSTWKFLCEDANRTGRLVGWKFGSREFKGKENDTI
jgi:hypothetical protein